MPVNTTFRGIDYFESTFRDQINANGEIENREFVFKKRLETGRNRIRLKPEDIVLYGCRDARMHIRWYWYGNCSDWIALSVWEPPEFSEHRQDGYSVKILAKRILCCRQLLYMNSI